MFRSGDFHERHLPGRPLTAQEKAVVVTLVLFVALMVGGFVAVIVVETRNATVCGAALVNPSPAPKPTPPPNKA